MAALENNFEGKSMWVVKIGGSLLGSPELERWLEVVAKHGDGKIIIVPGGGLFANAVRDAQKISKISDACAHKLAVLAMDQFGLMLANMNPALATARTECEIDTIPQSWDVTSDSIAAWLAQKLDAKHLVLIKSDKPGESKLELKTITASGLVDREFGDFALDKVFSSWIVKKTDSKIFSDGITESALTKVGSSVH
jgi:aspartokinase-like uncharacterized kinase